MGKRIEVSVSSLLLVLTRHLDVIKREVGNVCVAACWIIG